MRKALQAANAAYLYITGKGTRKVLFLFFAILVSGFVAISINTIYARVAHAATNNTINFQARVLNAGGSVVADGGYTVAFTVYDTEIDGTGTAQWTETQAVTAKNGYISTSLGSVNPFGASIDWSQEHWLTMNVNGDGEMLQTGGKRIRITATPYSFRSGQADSLTNGSGTISASQLAQLAPGVVQGVSSANDALRINQTGTGGLLQLQFNGTNELTVANNGDTAIGGSLAVNGGLTVGNSTSTTAGTIRWTGAVFEGYNGSAWTSLGGSALGTPIINKVKLTNEVQNSTVNATATLQNDDELFFAIGANETWTYRFLVYGNANATPDFKFAVTAPGGATCSVGYSDPEGATSISNLGCGVSTGLIAGNTANDFYEIVGTITNGANAGTVQLQWAQNTANAANSTIYAGSSVIATRAVGANGTAQAFIQNGNSFGAAAYLGTNDGNDLNLITNSQTRLTVSASGNVGIGDTTPAALLTVGTNDAMRVNASGDIATTGTLTVNGQTQLGSSLVAGATATAISTTTEPTPRTNVTTITLASGVFANNDVLFVDNAGQDYYTRIVSGGGTASVVISPAVSYDASATVTKYNVQNIGATSTDYTNQANRFFQGYFLGGVVIGAGSTTISDGNIESTTTLNLQKNGGLISIGGDMQVAGTLSGDASGLININASQISGGTVSDTNLSGNVTLVGNIFNGASQLVQLDASGALPALNGSLLTALDASNISTGTLDDARLGTNVTLLGNTTNAANGLVKLDASGNLPALSGAALTSLSSSALTGALPALNGTALTNLSAGNLNGALPALNASALTSLNASNISSGTLDNARLSSSVTLLGNTVNAANGLVQIDASGKLPSLDGSALTSLNASNLSNGTVSDSLISSNITKKGNTFNGASELVLLDASGNLPALNGSALTNLSAANLSGALPALNASALTNLSSSSLTGALPALNGSALTNLSATNIASGTLDNARLSTNVTILGNTTNSANGLVKLDASGNLPSLNGSALTSLNAGNLSSGTISDSLISNNITKKGNTFNGASQLVLLDASGDLPILNASALTNLSSSSLTGALPALNGSALTSLNAGNIASGTVGDSYLSNNIARLGTSQIYTAQQTFESNIIIGTDTASPNAGIITFNDAAGSNGFTATLGVSTTLGGNRNIYLPDENGTLCIRGSSACGFVMLGSATVQTDNTNNPSIFINKAAAATGNIMTLQKDGTTVYSVLNNGALQLALTDTSAFTVSGAGGTTQYFDVDTAYGTGAGLVQIGGASVDGNATLLVLDTKNTTGDPSGVNGGSYYNSATGKSRCYENNIWTDCVSLVNENKTADQTITNSATMTNDTNLAYAMAANASYKIDATINYTTTSANADFKYTFTVPTGATVRLSTDADISTTTRTICNIASSGQVCTLASTANFRGNIRVTGIVTTAATAGNVQFQFAQNTQTAAQSVTVYKGSLLSAVRTDQ